MQTSPHSNGARSHSKTVVLTCSWAGRALSLPARPCATSVPTSDCRPPVTAVASGQTLAQPADPAAPLPGRRIESKLEVLVSLVTPLLKQQARVDGEGDLEEL